jgi:hypothetical protein
VEVSAGTETWVELDFTAGNEVSGRITRNGQPLGDARIVFVPKVRSMQGGGGSMSDAAGSYTVSGLLDGEYDVSVLYRESVVPYTTSYEVRGNSQFDIDLRTGSVRGRVVDSSTMDPVEGASVALEVTQPGIRFGGGNVRTDSAGTFLLDSVAGGTYILRIAKEGFAQETKDVVASDGGEIEVEIRLQKSSGTELRIVDARDGREIGGMLSVADTSGRVVFEDAIRPQSGAGSRIALPAGSYRAMVTSGGYAPAVFDLNIPSATITVPVTRGGTLKIESSGQPVALRVLDSYGRPFRRYSWRSSDVMHVGPTGVTIDAIAAGQYTIEIPATGARETITIAEGQTTVVKK